MFKHDVNQPFFFKLRKAESLHFQVMSFKLYLKPALRNGNTFLHAACPTFWNLYPPNRCIHPVCLMPIVWWMCSRLNYSQTRRRLFIVPSPFVTRTSDRSLSLTPSFWYGLNNVVPSILYLFQGHTFGTRSLLAFRKAPLYQRPNHKQKRFLLSMLNSVWITLICICLIYAKTVLLTRSFSHNVLRQEFPV